MPQSVWDYIQEQHEEFARERYEEIRELSEEQPDAFNPALEDMAELKLKFHDFLEDNPESYAPSFTSLFQQHVLGYLRSHITVEEGTVDVDSAVDAVQLVLDQVQGTDLERMQTPFNGITDVLRPYTLRYEFSDGDRWEELIDALGELEELDDFAAVRSVWQGLHV